MINSTLYIFPIIIIIFVFLLFFIYHKNINQNKIKLALTSINKLFSTFQGLHTKKELPSTGIRSIIVKRFNRLKEDMWVEVKENNGTVFFCITK